VNRRFDGVISTRPQRTVAATVRSEIRADRYVVARLRHDQARRDGVAVPLPEAVRAKVTRRRLVPVNRYPTAEPTP
jgi:hypothetical protein